MSLVFTGIRANQKWKIHSALIFMQIKLYP